jgi:acyl-CoA synthetase (AMP-forming)/AMP-acid ligase II
MTALNEREHTMNIAMVLDLVADALGDRVALTEGGTQLTYRELRRLSQAAAAGLTSDGSGTLAYADVSSAAVPAALFGAAWAGASYAPLNFRLPADFLRAQVARLYRPTVVASGALVPQLTDPPAIERSVWLEQLVNRADGAPVAAEYEPDPPRAAVILFTSGSSGSPKAAVLSHDNLLSYIMDTVEFVGAGEDEGLMLAAPPFHIAGVAAVLSSIYSGRRLLPLATFTPESWLHVAQDQGATHAFVVPTMLARIVQSMESDPTLRVPTLRSISYGGARLATPILERALELFPDVDFVNAYGLTETSSTIAVLGPDDHRRALSSLDAGVRRRLQSVGKPLPGVEVVVVDEETGVQVPFGALGLIRVRGPQVSGEYLDTASGIDGSGWLVTGDIGFLDEHGYLFVEGRADDVIIKGGENLSPAEIEDALLRHASVQEAVVVGIPNSEWGESVGAAVVLAADDHANCRRVTVEELIGWVRASLGSLKTPSVVVIRDELPTTATGKVLRRVIREELARLADG